MPETKDDEARDDARARLAGLFAEDASAAAHGDVSSGEHLLGIRHIIHRNFRFVTKPVPVDLDNDQDLANPFEQDESSVCIGVAALMLKKDDFDSKEEPARRGDPNPFLQFRLKDDVVQDVLRNVQAVVDIAREENVTHLFLSEFGYPVPISAIDMNSVETARAAVAAKIEAIWSMPGKTQKPFIFAGSFHNPVTLQNEVPIFSPHLPKGEVKVHPKKTSAVVLQESIRVPANRALQIYRAGGLNIGFLVCLDAYDASQALAAVTHNVRSDAAQARPSRERIDILAVVSFAMAKDLLDLRKFEHALSQLGELLGCPVAYTHASTARKDVGCYAGGKPIAAKRSQDSDRVKFEAFSLSKAEYSAAFNRYRAELPRWASLFMKPDGGGDEITWTFNPVDP